MHFSRYFFFKLIEKLSRAMPPRVVLPPLVFWLTRIGGRRHQLLDNQMKGSQISKRKEEEEMQRRNVSLFPYKNKILCKGGKRFYFWRKLFYGCCNLCRAASTINAFQFPAKFEGGGGGETHFLLFRRVILKHCFLKKSLPPSFLRSKPRSAKRFQLKNVCFE